MPQEINDSLHSDSASTEPHKASRPMVFIIRSLHWVYKRALSPFFGNACRFHPFCSDYMVAAVEKHGLLKGSWLGVKRLCKCHPFHPGGFDPVP